MSAFLGSLPTSVACLKKRGFPKSLKVGTASSTTLTQLGMGFQLSFLLVVFCSPPLFSVLFSYLLPIFSISFGCEVCHVFAAGLRCWHGVIWVPVWSSSGCAVVGWSGWLPVTSRLCALCDWLVGECCSVDSLPGAQAPGSFFACDHGWRLPAERPQQ